MCVYGIHYLRVEQVRVHHGPLDVVQVGVVLQRPLQEAGLLAQLGDVGAVVVGEHLVAQDGVSDLGRGGCGGTGSSIVSWCQGPRPKRVCPMDDWGEKNRARKRENEKEKE